MLILCYFAGQMAPSSSSDRLDSGATGGVTEPPAHRVSDEEESPFTNKVNGWDSKVITRKSRV